MVWRVPGTQEMPGARFHCNWKASEAFWMKTLLNTEEADENMLTYNVTNWIETQKKLKWRQAF